MPNTTTKGRIYSISLLTHDGSQHRRDVIGEERLCRILDAFQGKVIDCEVSMVLTDHEITQRMENHNGQATTQA